MAVVRTMRTDRSTLITERRNPASGRLDRLDAPGIVRLINSQDANVASAVRKQSRRIAAAAEMVAAALRNGGRLIYVGAGTSGRLGVLDAAECPPTFGVPRTMVRGVIAGGRRALWRSVEGAEDRASDGAAEMTKRRVGGRDVVLGIAACGMTPFVHGALRRAGKLGAATVFLTCAAGAVGENSADLVIRTVVGPEVLTGSTRMKAGTATKMVLNMITTTAMVLLGKVYGNLMVDLKATNAKLRDRAERIVMAATGIGRPAARTALRLAGGRAKAAILMKLTGLRAGQAESLLVKHGGSLRKAIKDAREC